MSWIYVLQCELPVYPHGKNLKWEDIAYSNDVDALTSQLLPNNRVINIQTKEVIAKHEIQRVQ